MATTPNRRNAALKEAMTKTRLLDALAESTGLQRKDVASVLDELGVVIERHVKRRAVTRGGNVHASRPVEAQGSAQARKKGAQDAFALHRPGDHGGREARLEGGEGSAPERAQAHDGVGPGQREGRRLSCSDTGRDGYRSRAIAVCLARRLRRSAPLGYDHI